MGTTISVRRSLGNKRGLAQDILDIL